VVELGALDDLFDFSATPAYPHAGPIVQASVAEFLVRSARSHRREAKLEVEVVLAGPVEPAAREEAARIQFGRYFANETERTMLEIRANRAEGIGAFWYAIPFVLVAGVAAAIASSLYAGSGSDVSWFALVYLAFITIVWVMLWDPTEMLLFDSYLLRLRRRAMQKLAVAPVRIVYRSMPLPAATSPPG